MRSPECRRKKFKPFRRQYRKISQSKISEWDGFLIQYAKNTIHKRKKPSTVKSRSTTHQKIL